MQTLSRVLPWTDKYGLSRRALPQRRRRRRERPRGAALKPAPTSAEGRNLHLSVKIARTNLKEPTGRPSAALPSVSLRAGRTGRRYKGRSGVGLGFCLELGGLDDGAENAAATDDVFAGAGDGFEDEEAAFVSGETRVSADIGSDRGGFQVVNFDSCADSDGAGREFVADSLRGGYFHHSDHGGSGKDSGQARVVILDGPFEGNGELDCGFEADTRQIGLGGGGGFRFGFFLHGGWGCAFMSWL